MGQNPCDGLCVGSGESVDLDGHASGGFYYHIGEKQSGLYRNASYGGESDLGLFVAYDLSFPVDHAVVLDDDLIRENGVASGDSACCEMVSHVFECPAGGTNIQQITKKFGKVCLQKCFCVDKRP